MKRIWIAIAATFVLLAMILAADEKLGPPIKVVDPGGPAKAPSDAVVLFDGSTLDAWTHRDGSPVKWTIANGELICKTGSGDIFSKAKFKDAQIHVEFNTPSMPDAHGQARANSGVYLQGGYEIQVLDSFNNPTYEAGSAGSVYGQHDPLVNVTRPPGQWQTYDIIFHGPRCDAGVVKQPARVTILQNGVLIQDEATISGPTGGGDKADVCEVGPLRLQDHGYPGIKATLLKFRNIWFRAL